MRKIVSFFMMCCVLLSLTACSGSTKYTIKELDAKPFFNYSVYRNSEHFRGCMFKYKGVVDSIDGDEITIRMDIKREDGTLMSVFIVVDKDDILKNPKSSWENPSKDSYAVVIGEIEKIKENNKIYLSKWYYDEEAVVAYTEMKELEAQIEEENRIFEEEERKYEAQKVELDSILNTIEMLPVEISQINNWTSVRELLYQFTVKYPQYRDIDEVQDLLKSIDERISSLKQEKEEIESNKMTLEEGHIELDAILVGLGNEIVEPERLEQFNRLCNDLNYDNIVTLGTALEGTLNELYDIIRKPMDTTEYDKLVKRVNDFIVYCPNFSDDDVLTHKYEFIKNIILKELENK